VKWNSEVCKLFTLDLYLYFSYIPTYIERKVIKVEVSEMVAKIFFVVIGLSFIMLGIFVPRTEIEKVRAMFPIDPTSIGSIILSIVFTKAPWYMVKITIFFIGLSIITLMVLVTYS
jgi:hypothetical protein